MFREAIRESVSDHDRRVRLPRSPARFAADAGSARVGRRGLESKPPIEIIMPCEAGRISIGATFPGMRDGPAMPAVEAGLEPCLAAEPELAAVPYAFAPQTYLREAIRRRRSPTSE